MIEIKISDTSISPIVLIIFLILVGVLATLGIQKLITKKNSSGTGTQGNCDPSTCIILQKRNTQSIIIIFAVILTFLIVNLFVEDQEAMNYFSFASTISSIILSVLAIMMTIFSDAKNENTKALINKSVQSLESTAKDIQSYTDSFKEKSETQKETFERILETSKQILDLAKNIQSGVDAITLKSESRTVEATEYEATQYKLDIGEK